MVMLLVGYASPIIGVVILWIVYRGVDDLIFPPVITFRRAMLLLVANSFFDVQLMFGALAAAGAPIFLLLTHPWMQFPGNGLQEHLLIGMGAYTLLATIVSLVFGPIVWYLANQLLCFYLTVTDTPLEPSESASVEELANWRFREMLMRLCRNFTT